MNQEREAWVCSNKPKHARRRKPGFCKEIISHKFICPEHGEVKKVKSDPLTRILIHDMEGCYRPVRMRSTRCNYPLKDASVR
jgi:hypothetical protein